MLFRSLLMKITNTDTTSPAFGWAKQVDMGVGSNIDSVDVDASGNIYTAFDRRGATTFFSAGKWTPDGALAWGKTWDNDNTGDNNNTYVVRVDGADVYVGGRIAFQPFDTQYGDGFIMKLAAADGAYDWGTFFYNGKGAEEMTEHRVKGIVPDSGKLLLGVQSYTNGLDFEHYWGYWYDATDAFAADPPGTGAVRLVDYAPSVTDVPGVTMTVPPTGTSHVIAGSAWVAPPSNVTWTDSVDTVGNGGDGDTTLMILDLN